MYAYIFFEMPICRPYCTLLRCRHIWVIDPVIDQACSVMMAGYWPNNEAMGYSFSGRRSGVFINPKRQQI